MSEKENGKYNYDLSDEKQIGGNENIVKLKWWIFLFWILFIMNFLNIFKLLHKKIQKTKIPIFLFWILVFIWIVGIGLFIMGVVLYFYEPFIDTTYGDSTFLIGMLTFSFVSIVSSFSYGVSYWQREKHHEEIRTQSKVDSNVSIILKYISHWESEFYRVTKKLELIINNLVKDEEKFLEMFFYFKSNSKINKEKYKEILNDVRGISEIFNNLTYSDLFKEYYKEIKNIKVKDNLNFEKGTKNVKYKIAETYINDNEIYSNVLKYKNIIIFILWRLEMKNDFKIFLSTRNILIECYSKLKEQLNLS